MVGICVLQKQYGFIKLGGNGTTFVVDSYPIVVEIFDVVKHQKTFNESKYIKNLKQLPKEPFE